MHPLQVLFCPVVNARNTNTRNTNTFGLSRLGFADHFQFKSRAGIVLSWDQIQAVNKVASVQHRQTSTDHIQAHVHAVERLVISVALFALAITVATSDLNVTVALASSSRAEVKHAQEKLHVGFRSALLYQTNILSFVEEVTSLRVKVQNDDMLNIARHCRYSCLTSKSIQGSAHHCNRFLRPNDRICYRVWLNRNTLWNTFFS
jgi:hypothetical protein